MDKIQPKVKKLSDIQLAFFLDKVDKQARPHFEREIIQRFNEQMNNN